MCVDTREECCWIHLSHETSGTQRWMPSVSCLSALEIKSARVLLTAEPLNRIWDMKAAGNSFPANSCTRLHGYNRSRRTDGDGLLVSHIKERKLRGVGGSPVCLSVCPGVCPHVASTQPVSCLLFFYLQTGKVWVILTTQTSFEGRLQSSSCIWWFSLNST